MLSLGLMYVILGFHKHKKPEARKAPDIFVYLDSRDDITKYTEELIDAEQSYPWLEFLIKPALESAVKLESEYGNETDYQTDLDSLRVDVWQIKQLELNDTI